MPRSFFLLVAVIAACLLPGPERHSLLALLIIALIVSPFLPQPFRWFFRGEK
jgi:hypothetical protein